MIGNETAVLVRDLSVAYRRPKARATSIRGAVSNMARLRFGVEEFWALRAVSLRIRRGEVLGVVGANGAGKSTLLKSIAAVLPPTAGRVAVRGRIAPLLELGAGLDPELSAVENVVLQGALLGQHPRVVRARAEEIIEYAGVSAFADQPLRSFSSGMLARLAFAVATTCDPDVLLIDEVLAVGDAEFQTRSSARITSLLERGAAVALVSHDLGAIRQLSDRVLWLDRGEAIASGHPESVLHAYAAHVAALEAENEEGVA